jgi:hypothetical protein
MAKKDDGPQFPERNAGRRRTGYPESENLLLRSSSLGHRKLNFAVRPRELRLPSPDGSRDHLVHQYERCKSAESRINLLHQHAAAPLRHGRDARLVSSIRIQKVIAF